MSSDILSLDSVSPGVMAVCWEQFNLSFKRTLALAADEDPNCAAFSWEALSPESREAIQRELFLIVKLHMRDLAKGAER